MEFVYTDNAPKAIGPYSQAVKAASTVYCSGQIPMDPVTMKIDAQEIAGQTRRVLQNLAAVLQAAGSSPQQVVKTTVYLADMAEFSSMNAEYERFFQGHRPARATVEVARLPKDVRVEIDCIAVTDRE